MPASTLQTEYVAQQMRDSVWIVLKALQSLLNGLDRIGKIPSDDQYVTPVSREREVHLGSR